jgi:hypothetical protein
MHGRSGCLVGLLATMLGVAGCGDGTTEPPGPTPITGGIWSARFGAKDTDEVNAIAVDADGNGLLVGVYQGAADFGGGPLPAEDFIGTDENVFVLALDPDGQHRWSRGFGDVNVNQRGEDIAVDGAGDVVAVGSFVGGIDFGGGKLQSDASAGFVVKLDGEGQHLWSTAFAPLSEPAPGGSAITTVAIAPDGHAFVGGSFSGTLELAGLAPIESSDGDGFVAELDAGGAALRIIQLPGPGQAGVNDLVLFDDGSIAVTGVTRGVLDLGVTQIGAGTTPTTFVAMLDAAGVVSWALPLGGDFRAPAITRDGSDLLVAGTFEGALVLDDASYEAPDRRAFAARLAANGDVLWSAVPSGDAPSSFAGIAATGDGGLVATGHFDGVLTWGGAQLVAETWDEDFGNDDVLVVRFDAAGEPQWARRYGEDNSQNGLAVAVTEPGILVTGNFKNRIDFGPGPMQAASEVAGSVETYTDVFVALLQP